MNTEELEKKLDALTDDLDNDAVGAVAFGMTLAGRDTGKEIYDALIADTASVEEFVAAGGWKALKKRLDQLAFDACKLRDYVAEKKLP